MYAAHIQDVTNFVIFGLFKFKFWRIGILDTQTIYLLAIYSQKMSVIIHKILTVETWNILLY